MKTPIVRVLEAGLATTAYSTSSAESGHGQSWFSPSAYVFANIEIRSRGIATGMSCLPIAHPQATASGLKTVCNAIEGYLSFRIWDSAFGHHSRCASESAHGAFGARLIDIAILDALLGSFGCNLFEGMAKHISGTDRLYVSQSRGPSKWGGRSEPQRRNGTDVFRRMAAFNRGRSSLLGEEQGSDTTTLLREAEVSESSISGAFAQPLAYTQQLALRILANAMSSDALEGTLAEIVYGPGLASSGLSIPTDLVWH